MNRFFDRQIGPMGGMQPNPSDLNRSPQPMGEMNQGPPQRGMGPGTDQVGYGEGDLPDPTDPPTWKDKVHIRYGSSSIYPPNDGLKVVDEWQRAKDNYQVYPDNISDEGGETYNPEYMKAYLNANKNKLYWKWGSMGPGDASRLVDMTPIYQKRKDYSIEDRGYVEGSDHHALWYEYVFEFMQWDEEKGQYVGTGQYYNEPHGELDEGQIGSLTRAAQIEGEDGVEIPLPEGYNEDEVEPEGWPRAANFPKGSGGMAGYKEYQRMKGEAKTNPNTGDPKAAFRNLNSGG